MWRRDPVLLEPGAIVMGTDDLQEHLTKEQPDIRGLLIAPGIFVAVVALIYTWT